ncbi:MAG TPA: acyltransferase [Opitutaceae bacterium]|nr:acyltransferase [Opitutaceae bacterium]
MPALDGIRAVAILGVLVYHLRPATLPGESAGVDVFFVLSGYLITRLVLQDIAAGQFSFREFYSRRIQRLVSNAGVSFIGCVIASYIRAHGGVFSATHPGVGIGFGGIARDRLVPAQ